MGGLVPPGDPAGRAALRGLPETRGHPMSSSEFHHYTRDQFLADFYPDHADKVAIAAGLEQLRAEQRACRLAARRRRLRITHAEFMARLAIPPAAGARSTTRWEVRDSRPQQDTCRVAG